MTGLRSSRSPPTEVEGKAVVARASTRLDDLSSRLGVADPTLGTEAGVPGLLAQCVVLAPRRPRPLSRLEAREAAVARDDGRRAASLEKAVALVATMAPNPSRVREWSSALSSRALPQVDGKNLRLSLNFPNGNFEADEATRIFLRSFLSCRNPVPYLFFCR